MTLYYCINEVLDRLDKTDKSEDNHFQSLISVSTTLPDCDGHSEDAFTLQSTPKLLDLRETDNAHLLADLIENVPLYNINMELILDQALAERHHNSMVENALNQAFKKQPLPNTLKADGYNTEDLSSGLRHPMLGHLDKKELCSLYIVFLKSLGAEQDSYRFERDILGKHTDRFLEYFDGYATIKGGKIKAMILLAFGMRQDNDDVRAPLETYIENGEKQAKAMQINEPHKLLWAWMEADNYQMRRCHDLDRVMKLTSLPKTPNWVRTDIFSCLGKEAMKQIFAAILIQKDPELTLLKNSELLQKSIYASAKEQIDENLQHILSKTTNQKTPYSSAAAKFVEEAKKRDRESKQTGIS